MMHAVPAAIDVWWIPVAGVDCASLLPLLDDHEREMSARFLRAADRRRYVVVHAAVRSILATYFTPPPTDIRIRRTSTGQPVLDGSACSVHFSMAKRQLFGLLAVSPTPVGVDVEILANGDSLPESGRGLPMLRSELHGAREWAAREAYAKLTGLGILGIASEAIPSTVRCVELPAPPGYIATIATHDWAAHVGLHRWRAMLA
jgi:4'-phosphopantetheinyl transferase